MSGSGVGRPGRSLPQPGSQGMFLQGEHSHYQGRKALKRKVSNQRKEGTGEDGYWPEERKEGRL